MGELKSCPFCGGEAELKRYQSGGWQMVCNHADGCIMLKAYFDNYYWENVQVLARRWNTRAPEQAVAATHGTLTAEQVMAIAGKHQPDYCSDTHVCFDWQAIADELNATLGSGECELVDRRICKFYHTDIQLCDAGVLAMSFCPCCEGEVAG